MMNGSDASCGFVIYSPLTFTRACLGYPPGCSCRSRARSCPSRPPFKTCIIQRSWTRSESAALPHRAPGQAMPTSRPLNVNATLKPDSLVTPYCYTSNQLVNICWIYRNHCKSITSSSVNKMFSRYFGDTYLMFNLQCCSSLRVPIFTYPVIMFSWIFLCRF